MGRKGGGYPERYAQKALGHASAAIHRAYAKKARVEVPPLEEFEKLRAGAKVIPLPTPNPILDITVLDAMPIPSI